MYAFRLGVQPLMVHLCHSFILGKLGDNDELLLILPHISHLVSVLVFVFLLLFFIPSFRLTPGTTKLVVVPVVFKAGFACNFKFFKGTVLIAGCVLSTHVRQIPTQLHCVHCARLARYFELIGKDLEFRLVFFHEMDWVGQFFDFQVFHWKDSMVILLGAKISGDLRLVPAFGFCHQAKSNPFCHRMG